MPFPVPHITTFVLLLHMVLGCCMHHAHTCETGCRSKPALAAQAGDCDSHQHANHDDHAAGGRDHGSEPGKHSGKHHCQGDRCTFLQKQPSPEQLGVFAVDSCPLEAVVPASGVDGAREFFDRIPSQPLLQVGTSLRTHLALRVLLI